MLKRLMKLKASTYQHWYKSRLEEAPMETREQLSRGLKDVHDIYPRPILLGLAFVSALFAGTGAYQAIEAWQIGNWTRLAMFGVIGLFFTICAVAWLRKWKARGRI
jgi:hypothetical protein